MGAEFLVAMLVWWGIIWILIFENPLISEVITSYIETKNMRWGSSNNNFFTNRKYFWFVRKTSLWCVLVRLPALNFPHNSPSFMNDLSHNTSTHEIGARSYDFFQAKKKIIISVRWNFSMEISKKTNFIILLKLPRGRTRTIRRMKKEGFIKSTHVFKLFSWWDVDRTIPQNRKKWLLWGNLIFIKMQSVFLIRNPIQCDFFFKFCWEYHRKIYKICHLF
jgi:hypothetical protein